MVKGFDDDAEWSVSEEERAGGGGERKREENSIRVRMHHQLFQFPNSISHRFYLLYADSLKVLSLSRGKAPDRLLRRNQRLPMLVLVLFRMDKEE